MPLLRKYDVLRIRNSQASIEYTNINTRVDVSEQENIPITRNVIVTIYGGQNHVISF